MTSASGLWLGCRVAQVLAGALSGRDTRVVAGAACAGKEVKGFPPGITWTTTGLREGAAPVRAAPGPYRAAGTAPRNRR